MLNIIDLSMNLFSTVITYFLSDYFFDTFGAKNKNTFIDVLSTVSFVAFFFSLNYVESKIANVIIMALCTFTVTLKYDFKLYNKILFTVLFVVISALAELIAGLFVMIVFSLDSVGVRSGEYYLGVVLSEFLALIFFFVIRSFNMLIIKIVDGIIDSHINENKLYVAEEIIKRQTEQYDLLLKNNDEILKLKHDYKNFIIGTLTEIRNKNYKTIEDRLTEQADILNEFSGDSISGNSIIDTVLGYKTSVAKAKNIDVLVTHKNLQNICVSGIDMSILLGNALDNAIEAVDLLEAADSKRIEVLLCVKNSQIFITVKNPVKTNVNIRNLQTSKKDKFAHGYGILNMRSIVRKYDGSVTFDCENNIFSTFIILKNINE